MTPQQKPILAGDFGTLRDLSAYWLTVAAAATTVVSIAASQTLLALALVALLASGRPLRIPPIWIPLSIFLLWTLASLAVSSHPLEGWPQVKKFYVYLMLPVVYSGIRVVSQARVLLLGVIGGATLSGLWSFVQFYRKFEAIRAADQPFYESYVAAQVTGFMGHWMTFSGEIMIALLILLAFLLFAPLKRSWILPALLVAAILLAALLIGYVRTMWVGFAIGSLYLIWFWQRRLLLLLPVLAGLAYGFAPPPLRARIVAIYHPQSGLVDSRRHREVLRETGLRMIEAHPFFGVGPQQVKDHFLEYYPQDAPHPIPYNWWYDHLHNIYFHYAAERGVPALLALLAMIAAAGVAFIRALRRAPAGRGEPRWILQAAVVVILSVMVAGWAEYNLNDSEVLGLFLSVLACGYVAAEEVVHA